MLDMAIGDHKLVVRMTIIDFEFQMDMKSAPRGQICSDKKLISG